MNMDKNTIDRHHLLEIILWPNNDGTFRTIHNSATRLKELGIYDDFKMTIPLTRSEHSKLHHIGKKLSEETRKKMCEMMKGRQITEEHRKKLSESKKGKKRKPFSEETKKKMSESAKGRKLSEEHRKKLNESTRGKTWKIVNGKRVWIEKEAL